VTPLLAYTAILLQAAAGPSYPAALRTPSQVIWRAPHPMTLRDWTCGPDGCRHEPAPPFRFVRAQSEGTSPKVLVRDRNGRTWSVKFGAEVIPECFGARFITALGYTSELNYCVSNGSIEGLHDLPRVIKHAFRADGSFDRARFELRDDVNFSFLKNRSWAWNDNPFSGTHELAGLKVAMLLLSNWDAKDTRNGDDTNNGVFQTSIAGRPVQLYSMFDWGASLGKWGPKRRRDKSDCVGFSEDTAHFIKGVRNGRVQWGFSGKHAEDLKDVTVEDLRWMWPYLSQITSEELYTGLTASGATPRQAGCWTSSLVNRIHQVEAIVQSPRRAPLRAAR
jgi:hypothetical protein